jgi:hypothetical protein
VKEALPGRVAVIEFHAGFARLKNATLRDLWR